ncbi:hypothetical protein HJC23_005387 [Cyclotella cryptica]|uniref:Uncharacterized protein n=1 Tax=Cyclotella cryptica TaxID=29204 RepID=A0ABD3P1R9_9STRA
MVLSRRWGPRLVHVDQNAAQDAGGQGGVSHTVPPPADITAVTTPSSTQCYHGSLGNRFQPPSSKAKAPIVTGGRVMDSLSANSLPAAKAPRWNSPSTEAAPSLSTSTTALKLPRWSAPNNTASSKMSTNPVLPRWTAPPSVASKSSLTNLAPSAQHTAMDPHHLPLKKRFYVGTSLTDTLREFDRMTEQHPIVTSNEEEEEHSTSIPQLDSEGESLDPITKDEHSIIDTRSNCRNEDRHEFPQLVPRQRVVSKDEPLEQCTESLCRAQVFRREIDPLPISPTRLGEPCSTFDSQKSNDVTWSERTEVRSVEVKSYISSKVNGEMSSLPGLSTTEPRSPPSSKIFSSRKSPVQSPFKRILSSVKSPTIKREHSFNESSPSMVHDLNVSRDRDQSSSILKKPPHIHIKIPKSISHDKSLNSPGRAHIHIKLPKITKTKSPDESLDAQDEKSKAGTTSTPDVSQTAEGLSVTQKLPELPASMKDAYPKQLHVPHLASARVDIESKAQQILAKARMRLQSSAGLKEPPSTPTFESRIKTQHGTLSNCEPLRPAVLSESPLSIRCGELLHSEQGTESSKLIASLEPTSRRDVLKPKGVHILHSEISIPRKTLGREVFSSIPDDDPSCDSKTDIAKPATESNTNGAINKAFVLQDDRLKDNGSKPTSYSDTRSVDTKPKKFKRLRKNVCAPLPNMVKKPSARGNSVSTSDFPRTKSRKASKKISFDLSSLYKADLDSDSSDSDSSTDTSSSSSTDSSTSSSSSSSSCSSSTCSSSDSSSDSDRSSSCSSSCSSDSDSSSDLDTSSDEDDNIRSYRLFKKTTPKRTLKKPRHKYRSRRRASKDVIMGPAPPKEQELTDMEIRKILQQDSSALGMDNTTWARRSSRQPSKNLINSASVKDLLNRLQCNDSDMVVLKMKKYLNDPNLPPVVMNAALDALEENSNCQALYIQVRIIFCVAFISLELRSLNFI